MFCRDFGVSYIWSMELSKFKKDSSCQRIKASYLDESSVELTEREAEKKKRMSYAWSLRLNNKYSTYQVIQILMRDHGISQASAYREYNMSMQIFGELEATTLAAERQILKEAFWNEYQKAVKAGNGDLAVKALKEYKEISNIDKNENEIDPNKIQAHEYIIRMPRRIYKMMDKNFVYGVINFNDLEIEDAEFREVEENEDNDE